MKVVPGPQLPSVLTDRSTEEEEEGVGQVVLVLVLRLRLVRKVSWYSSKGCELERLTSPGSWQGSIVKQRLEGLQDRVAS